MASGDALGQTEAGDALGRTEAGDELGGAEAGDALGRTEAVGAELRTRCWADTLFFTFVPLGLSLEPCPEVLTLKFLHLS